MRGLLFIGILVALVIVAYLQLQSSQTAIKTGTADKEQVQRQVKQQIDAAMKKNMEKLQHAEKQAQ